MTIVEKAVDKLGKGKAARRPSDEDAQAQVPSVAEPAPERPSTVEQRRRVGARSLSGAHRGKVVLDRSALREAGFLAPEEYERRLAEEYRRIKRPLLANAFGIGVTRVEQGNLVMIASAMSGEGKTHTCINLALSMAMEKERTVLLVDGDVAKPTISRLFDLEDNPGLLDLLEADGADPAEAIVHTDVPGLRLLPAGRPRDSATELLASNRMRELAYDLSARYHDRIILFDSPPLLATSEALAIAAVAGQVALVVAAGLTPRSAVREALDHLRPEQAVNVVLNKQRYANGEGYYGGYYGRYGYGQRPNDADAA